MCASDARRDLEKFFFVEFCLLDLYVWNPAKRILTFP